MAYALQVFVSSTCYELRDLRASIADWLIQLGMQPVMSDEGGFPHIDGMPPYATCLRALEECPLVIGVIDRQYGHAFDDWGPYVQHKGCAPTHAELRHALDIGKRVLIYVQNDVWTFYEVWRKNKEAFKHTAPAGLQEGTLHMLHELKLRQPAPWIEHFTNASDLQRSLNREFINQLYTHLRDREKQTADLASYLLEKISDASPEVRNRIAAGVNPELVADREGLRLRLTQIEGELSKTKDATEESISRLGEEKAAIQAQLETATQSLDNAKLMLARAATKDFSWLDFVRRTMMPKQPGRVPFHNAAEVSMRGFHSAGAGASDTPFLHEVTWSPLAPAEGGLHRGYQAGLIFKGAGFGPGVTWTCRRLPDGGSSPTEASYPWRLSNIYFGDYLEVSTATDPIEGPLSWRGYEFQVKNPTGVTSEWVPFSYKFNDDELKNVQRQCAVEGMNLIAAGRAADAVEPLRKAYVFADRILGPTDPETLRAKSVLDSAQDKAALARLRFRVGDRLLVRSGPSQGKVGVITSLKLNHLHAYVMRTDGGEEFQTSDEQVDCE